MKKSIRNNPVVPRAARVKGALGDLLRHTREKKGLSIDQVADELYLQKRQIRALEEEDFSNLPHMAFAKGFALNYARHLHLDRDEISALFERSYPESLRVEKFDSIYYNTGSMGTINRDYRRKLNINPLLLFATIAVFALGIFLIRMVVSAENKQNIQPVVEESMSDTDQKQGALLEKTTVGGMGAVGSAINLDTSDVSTSTIEE